VPVSVSEPDTVTRFPVVPTSALVVRSKLPPIVPGPSSSGDGGDPAPARGGGDLPPPEPAPGPDGRVHGCHVPADRTIVSTAAPCVLMHEFKHYFEGAWHQ
jgi:hypothetical protein